MSKCFYCDGTGKYKKPNNEKEFDRLFDYYDAKANFDSLGDIRNKALNAVGYTEIDCPYCSENQKMQSSIKD